MKPLSVAILGAGISGLTFAAQLSKMPQIRFKVFQKSIDLGGRVHSPKIAASMHADLGANIIDFDHKEQEKLVRQFLGSLNVQSPCDKKLKILKHPFLIFDQKLREGDHYKDRYCYEGGFGQLLSDISRQIPKESILFNYEVGSVKRDNESWTIINKSSSQAYEQRYNFIVFALDGPSFKEIVSKSDIGCQSSDFKQMLQTEYTTQLSVAYTMKEHPPFSCILFKGHPITFISSHLQKYQQQNIAVFQMNQQFSNSHFSRSMQQINEGILKLLPKQMEGWIGECKLVKKWRPSLIKHKTKRDLSILHSSKQTFLVIGDIAYGSSRVTGAIETAIGAFRAFKDKINGVQK